MIKPMTDEEIALKKFLDEMCQLGYEQLKNKRHFPIYVEHTKNEEILQHVNYKKQEEIDKLINNLNKYTEFIGDCKLILFGSATNGMCQFYSDIDLCIDSKDEATIRNLYKIISNSLVSEYDILIYNNIPKGEKVLKDIEKEGVIIWSKHY